MKLKLVKPSQGVVWVRQGILACRQQWLGYVGLVGFMGLTALLLRQLGPLGALVFAGFMPVILAGFMLATRRVLTGQRITPAVMFEALQGQQAPRRAFAWLGLVYVVMILAVQFLAALLGPDAEVLEKAMRDAQQDPAALSSNPALLQSMLWFMGLMLPCTLLLWHTPALVMWARQPVAKALFFSAVASWRNIGAFAMYGVTWIGLTLAIGLADSLLLLIVPVPALANMVAVVASMLLAAAFHASLYFTVVDCFEPDGTAIGGGEGAGPGPDMA